MLVGFLGRGAGSGDEYNGVGLLERCDVDGETIEEAEHGKSGRIGSETRPR